mmetsp:Transcript_8117/g.23185  ORF Transcript_8117/g.23185 Transcript_8117/m.23185 type:complete len:250 (+) Transcript_8117:334-1083(+)
MARGSACVGRPGCRLRQASRVRALPMRRGSWRRRKASNLRRKRKRPTWPARRRSREGIAPGGAAPLASVGGHTAAARPTASAGAFTGPTATAGCRRRPQRWQRLKRSVCKRLCSCRCTSRRRRRAESASLGVPRSARVGAPSTSARPMASGSACAGRRGCRQTAPRGTRRVCWRPRRAKRCRARPWRPTWRSRRRRKAGSASLGAARVASVGGRITSASSTVRGSACGGPRGCSWRASRTPTSRAVIRS